MIRVRYFTVEGDTTEAMAEALRVLALGEPTGESVSTPVAALAAPAPAPPPPVATEPTGPVLKLRFSEEERALLEAWVRDSGKSVVEWAKSLLLTVVGAKNADADGSAPAIASSPRPSPTRTESLPRSNDAPRPRHVEKEREFRARVNTGLNPALSVEAPATVGARVTIADHIRASFGKDENFPLPRLAELAYGQSTGETVAKLKMNINALLKQGHLARVGAASYRLIPESERREREAGAAQ